MEYLKLDEKAIRSWRLARGILLAIMTLVAAGMVAVSIPVDNGYISVPLRIAAAVIELFFIINIAVYPVIEYRQWKYAITEDRVEIEHGIFFIKRTIIPIVRIQNITVEQGPVNRKYGLYNVEIYIASGSHTIPCLDRETADTISENLKSRIYLRLEAQERKERP